MTPDEAPALGRDRRRFPWIRLLFLVGVLGAMFAAGWHEWNAHVLLKRARALEDRESYVAAFAAYATLVERFPFSHCVYEARAGVDRLEEHARASGVSRDLFAAGRGNRLTSWLDPYQVDLMPLFAFGGGGLLSFMVLVSRARRRKGIAFLAFLFVIASGLGVICTASQSGFLEAWQAELAPFAEPLPKPYLFYAALSTLSVSVLLGFSSTRRREPCDGPGSA